MLIATGVQMREIDRRAIEQCAIPGLLLMENAGHQAAQAALELLGDVRARAISVVAGTGNNGGDGLVAARHLQEAGARVTVYLVGPVDRLQGDARTMLAAWTGRGEKIEVFTGHLGDADLIIDAVIGTGCRGPLRPPANEAVRLMNRSSAPVLALDIPSGVDANNGAVYGEAVRATMTVTFALPKAGLLLYPGAHWAGRVVVAPISMPASVYANLNFRLMETGRWQSLLPERRSNAHKGSHGRILVIGGSTGLGGSIALTARAALRSGAGLVTMAVPQPVQPLVASILPEAMTVSLPADDQGQLASEALDVLLARVAGMDAVAVGPGLGTGPGVAAVVNGLLEKCQCPAVVDADALNVLLPTTRLFSAVLTPHPGEAGRLLNCSVSEIEQDRVASVRRLAAAFGAVTVLKGARTLIARPDGELFMEPSVNPILATAGTGDVLTGTIVGWLGQGTEPITAALGGVHLHAHAGLLLKKRLGNAGLLARELADSLPMARQRMESSALPRSGWLWDSSQSS